MRHLSTSLPQSHRAPQPQELLADFKAAALSVTNLYKSAASAQVKARAAGYQDALDDLLSFLDRENLGLMDGEGWRVRQWATERLDDAIPRAPGSDDEDDTSRDAAAETRSSSPETQRKSAAAQLSSDVDDDSNNERRVASEPPRQQTPPTTRSSHITTTHTVPTSDFTFQSNHTYPTSHDREVNPMDVDGSTETPRVMPRHKTRNAAHHRQRGDARSSFNLNISSGVGGKRKIPYPDFFDISGLNFDFSDKREGGQRGGKKGRFA